jgi:hypothetical protein
MFRLMPRHSHQTDNDRAFEIRTEQLGSKLVSSVQEVAGSNLGQYADCPV